MDTKASGKLAYPQSSNAVLPRCSRASGVRGALVKMLADMELGVQPDPVALRKNIGIGFEILKEAAEDY